MYCIIFLSSVVKYLTLPEDGHYIINISQRVLQLDYNIFFIHCMFITSVKYVNCFLKICMLGINVLVSQTFNTTPFILSEECTGGIKTILNEDMAQVESGMNFRSQ